MTRKKKLLIALAAGVVLGGIGCIVNANADKNRNSFFEANLEALSQTEALLPYICFHVVEETTDMSLYIEARKCIDCEVYKAKHISDQDRCDIL